MRYAKDAPQVYHDEDALTVCLEALATVARVMPDCLTLPLAERRLDQPETDKDARRDISLAALNVFRAREACRAEIARLEAVEVVA